jgi:plasmid maintenance system antidote protein VapI
MKRKIKQTELSADTGIHRAALSMQVYNARRPVSVATAKKIGRYVGLGWPAIFSMQRRKLLPLLRKEYRRRHYNSIEGKRTAA